MRDRDVIFGSPASARHGRRVRRERRPAATAFPATSPGMPARRGRGKGGAPAVARTATRPGNLRRVPLAAMSTSSNASADGGRRVRVGLIGSQFIAAIHAESLLRCPGAELYAVASPTPGNAQRLAQKHGVPHHFTDYRKMLERDELDMVVI